jgi:hypothetical protein
MRNHVPDPLHDPLSIGNLAISKGYATPKQIMTALKKQEQRQPLGEILVEDQVLTRLQLEELLHEQDLLRSKNRNHATKLVLQHQRGRIKDMREAFQDLNATVAKFANGKT